jgi:hypothetical protein
MFENVLGEGSDVHIMVQNVFMYLDSIVCNLLLLGLKVHVYSTQKGIQCVFRVSVLCISYNTLQRVVRASVLSSSYNTEQRLSGSLYYPVLIIQYSFLSGSLYYAVLIICSSYSSVSSMQDKNGQRRLKIC